MSKVKSILLVLSLIFLIILSASLVSWSVPAYPGQITDYYANAPTSEYDYIVGRYNTSFYYAKNGSTGNYDYLGVSYDNALQYAADALPYVNSVFCMDTGTTGYVTISCGHWVFDVASSVVYTIAPLTTCTIEDRHNAQLRYYNGGDLKYALDINMLNITSLCANYLYLGNLVTDPVGPIPGQLWYNSVEDTMKYYNGISIVVFPSIGGSSNSTYTLPFSYTIYQSGLTYYMEKYDGTTWSSTNASALFNAVSGNASALKGSVFVRNGDYNFTNPCILLNNTSWFGEGIGTRLFLAPNRPCAVNNDWKYWELFISEVLVENVTIQNIRFDGNYLNNNVAPNGTYLGNIGHGTGNIWLQAARHLSLSYCWLENHRVVGFSPMAYGVQSFDIHLDHCIATDNQWNQITLGAGDQDLWGSSIENCYTSGTCGDMSISLTGTGSGGYLRDCIVRGNTINGMTGTQGSSGSAWYGIKLETSYRNTVEDNNIYDVRMAIADDSSSRGNNTIKDNVIVLKDMPQAIGGDAPRGIEMDFGFNLIEGNTIYAPPTNNSIGMYLPTSEVTGGIGNNRVIANKFVNDGTGWMTVISDKGNYTLYTENDFSRVQNSATIFTFSGGAHGYIISQNIGFLTDNAGSQASCVNGTAIAHGLAGTPTSITISIRGTNPYVNATAWYFTPTVLTVNATHFTVSFCMNIGGTYTPVGTYDAKTIYWIAVYKP